MALYPTAEALYPRDKLKKGLYHGCSSELLTAALWDWDSATLAVNGRADHSSRIECRCYVESQGPCKERERFKHWKEI